MATLARDFVLETLTSPNVNKLFFQYGRTFVYPEGYRRDIAACIRNRRIEVTSDVERVYGRNGAPANASFVVDTPRGSVHPFFLNPRWTDTVHGRLVIKRLSPHEKADLKGTIIHEATHALQDFQRLDRRGRGRLRPSVAEGAAYLAGAITRRLHGYRMPPIANPRANFFLYTMDLADRYLAAWRPHRQAVIAQDDVTWVTGHAPTGSHDRYDFNGI
jgi:hypothetical protein